MFGNFEASSALVLAIFQRIDLVDLAQFDKENE